MAAWTRPVFDQPDASWIDNLDFDPEKHPDARALVGYVRKSPHSDSLQLYLDLDLHHYLEFQASDALDHKAYDGEGLSRMIVWLKGSAIVREVKVSTIESVAQFFGGRIADQYLKRAATEPSTILVAAVKGKTTLTGNSFCTGC